MGQHSANLIDCACVICKSITRGGGVKRFKANSKLIRNWTKHAGTNTDKIRHLSYLAVRGGAVIQVLGYKPEDPWLETRGAS
jgi:hypothetical protein